MQQPQRDPLDDLWTMGQGLRSLWHLDAGMTPDEVQARFGRGDTLAVCGRVLVQADTVFPWNAYLPQPDEMLGTWRACARCYRVLSTSDAYAAARAAIAKLRA